MKRLLLLGALVGLLLPAAASAAKPHPINGMARPHPINGLARPHPINGMVRPNPINGMARPTLRARIAY